MKSPLFILVAVIFLLSCSKQVMIAKEGHKMHDEYFYLKKNGDYRYKGKLFGVLSMNGFESGRYIFSNDTVYFINKLRSKVFETYGYGVLDSAGKKFYYMPDNPDKRAEFEIEYLEKNNHNNAKSHTVR